MWRSPGVTRVCKEEEASVSAEENKVLVRRLLEAEDKGDLDALDELLAPDFVDHNPLPGQAPGREGYMQGVAQDHDALSIALTTVDYQATDGDMVITRYTTRTVHDRGRISEWGQPVRSVRRRVSSYTTSPEAG